VLGRSTAVTALASLAIVSIAGRVSAQDPDSIRAALAQPSDSLLAVDSLLALDSLFADTLDTAPPLPQEVITHLGHLTTAFSNTPQRMGIIPAGMAEASIAAQYVQIAGRDPLSLRSMTENMVNVLHAIDPTAAGSGAGLGYGFKRAAEDVLTHIELAMAVDGASGAVLFHGPYIARAAAGAISRADDAIAMARQVRQGQSPETTLARVERLAALVRAMAYGDDRDGDGRIGQASTCRP
jgi:hypothetical protein